MTSGAVLEVGAGLSPDTRATETLDIREDLNHIDYPGIDIANDSWPIASNSFDRVIAKHVIEHIPPSSLEHVFFEADRVLRDEGVFEVVTPHAGSWKAATDPTHFGPGGWTPDVDAYFSGGLEDYFPQLDWAVRSCARLEFPVFVPKPLRIRVKISNGALSHELVKVPFVTGDVEMEAVVKS